MMRMPWLTGLVIAALIAQPAASQVRHDYAGGKTFAAGPSSFNDSGWTIQFQENFDTPFEAADGQQFGAGGWLTFQLINGGAVTIASGYALLKTPDFWNAALIRSTDILPSEYKIRVKAGYVNYDLGNYEPVDFSDPRFNTHSGYYENGVYWLTLTDDTCIGDECAESWWHYHRKMVIDVDNHLNYGGGETVHPVFMVYMAPQTNSGGNLLRTWNGVLWDKSPWNWNVAYTYAYDTWYYAELEKRNGYLVLRLYDSNRNVLEETTPVSLDSVHAIGAPLEYLFIGEPHTDDYEGNARFDEITLLIPQVSCCSGVTGNVDMTGIIDLSDLSGIVSFLTGGSYMPPCMDEANVNNEGIVDLSDLSALVSYLTGGGYTIPDCL